MEYQAVVMVGDPQQLPATLFSTVAKAARYGRSLFQVSHLFLTLSEAADRVTGFHSFCISMQHTDQATV
jgi:hypothetical protein